MYPVGRCGRKNSQTVTFFRFVFWSFKKRNNSFGVPKNESYELTQAVG
jgi:hypothetical protein